jgi:N-ethylmaleimide reductase
LLLEVMDAVVDEIGADKTGLRLSPVTPSNDAAQDSNPKALFDHVVDQLAAHKIAFLHVVEGQTGGPRDFAPFDFDAMRERFKRGNPNGAWMVNNGYNRQMALDVVAGGRADLVAFGRPFISNPDLVQRLRADAPLTRIFHVATTVRVDGALRHRFEGSMSALGVIA